MSRSEEEWVNTSKTLARVENGKLTAIVCCCRLCWHSLVALSPLVPRLAIEACYSRQLVVRRTDLSQPCWELIDGAKPSRDSLFAIAAASNISDQRSAYFFYKGSDCKYSQPCRPSGKGNCQTVLLYHVNSFKQYGNRWAWLSTHTDVIYGNRNLNCMWFWCLINHFLLIIFHRHGKSRDFS